MPLKKGQPLQQLNLLDLQNFSEHLIICLEKFLFFGVFYESVSRARESRKGIHKHKA